MSGSLGEVLVQDSVWTFEERLSGSLCRATAFHLSEELLAALCTSSFVIRIGQKDSNTLRFMRYDKE